MTREFLRRFFMLLAVGMLSSHGIAPARAENIDELIVRAENGEAAAQYRLGGIYANGRGVPLDETKAFYWMEQAALQGHRDAQFGVGVMYVEGLGVMRDRIQAYAWFHLAALAGAQNAAQVKNFLAQKMSPQERKEATKRAGELLEKIK